MLFYDQLFHNVMHRISGQMQNTRTKPVFTEKGFASVFQTEKLKHVFGITLSCKASLKISRDPLLHVMLHLINTGIYVSASIMFEFL